MSNTNPICRRHNQKLIKAFHVGAAKERGQWYSGGDTMELPTQGLPALMCPVPDCDLLNGPPCKQCSGAFHIKMERNRNPDRVCDEPGRKRSSAYFCCPRCEAQLDICPKCQDGALVESKDNTGGGSMQGADRLQLEDHIHIIRCTARCGFYKNYKDYDPR